MAKRKKRMNKKLKELIYTLLGFLAVAGIIALIILWKGAPTAKMAVSKYYTAVGQRDNKKYIDACYPSSWQKNYHPEGTDISLDDIVTNALSFQTAATFSDLKIIKKEKLSDEMVTAFNESVKKIYGFDIKAKKMYQLTFSMEMHMEGSEVASRNTGFITRYVYKVGGRWYFFADTLVAVDMGLE